MAIRLNDKSAYITSRSFRDGGQLVAPSVFARTGIQNYYAKELGAEFKNYPPKQVIKVMRLEDHVFDPASLQSYIGAPITIGHPAADVDVENYKNLAVGSLATPPERVNDSLAGVLVINDASAIDLIEKGVNELSVGYTANIRRVTDQADYHAIMTDIKVNHIAIVKKGRAGSTFRIGDTGEEIELNPEELEAQRIADEAAETQRLADEALAATEATKEVKVLDQAMHDSVLAELDVTKAKLADAELAVAAARLTDAQIGELVSAKLAFITDAQTISSKEVIHLAIPEARRVVLADAGIDVSGKSDAYVEAMFEIKVADAKAETKESSEMSKELLKSLNVSVQDANKVEESPAEKSRLAMIERNSKGTK